MTGSAIAGDARSIALGGSAITQGRGIPGVFANPATLMHLKRKSKKVHIGLGVNVDFRDPGTVFDSIFSKDTLVDDIETATDVLGDSQLLCDTLDNISLDTVCLTNTGALGQDFADLINEINEVSGAPIELIGQAQSGLGFTKKRLPFALHFGFSIVGVGELIGSQDDIEYLTALQDALIDGELTVADVIDTVVAGTQLLELSDLLDGTLDVLELEDVLTSEFEGTRVDRQQVGISFGHSFKVANRLLDIGVTPKFSNLTIFHTAGVIAEDLDDDTPSIGDNFNDSETSTTTFTADLGATYALSDRFAVSSVFRNIFSESVTTSIGGFRVETTPQVIVGGVYQFSNFLINADVALNSARRDGVETQPLALGLEYGRKNYSLRGGISVDNGRTEEEAAFTFGFGLGPFALGSRISSLKSIQTGIQLSFSF